MAIFDISQLAKWCSEVQFKIAEDTAKAAREIGYKLIEESPYDTGRYVANWRIGKSQSISGMTESKETKVQAKSDINSYIDDGYFFTNDKVVIYNTAKYHDKVEDKGWVLTDAYQPIRKTLSWAMNNLGKK